MLVRESRTSSANGAFGLHEWHESAGMRRHSRVAVTVEGAQAEAMKVDKNRTIGGAPLPAAVVSAMPPMKKPSATRFPAPWSAELQPNYYVVRDADGQQLAYVYYESEPGRRSAAKLSYAALLPLALTRLAHAERPC
jgi:hypothetical protein